MQVGVIFRTLRTTSFVLALPVLLIASYSCGGLVAPTGTEGTEHTGQASSQADAVATPVAGPANPVSCLAWANAVVANTGNVMLNAGALIDSYQPAVGPYGGANTGNAASVEVATTLTNNGGDASRACHAEFGRQSLRYSRPSRSHEPSSRFLGPPGIPEHQHRLGRHHPLPRRLRGREHDVQFFQGAISVSPQGKVRIWVTGNHESRRERCRREPAQPGFSRDKLRLGKRQQQRSAVGAHLCAHMGINLDSTVFGAVIEHRRIFQTPRIPGASTALATVLT